MWASFLWFNHIIIEEYEKEHWIVKVKSKKHSQAWRKSQVIKDNYKPAYKIFGCREKVAGDRL